MFISSDEVSWEDHQLWYERSLRMSSRWILVGEEGDRPMGVLRLDRTAGETATISVNVGPECRGRGIGKEILRLGADFAAQLGLASLEANIKTGNAASIALFRGAGFDHVGFKGGLERYMLHLPVAPGRGS